MCRNVAVVLSHLKVNHAYLLNKNVLLLRSPLLRHAGSSGLSKFCKYVNPFLPKFTMPWTPRRKTSVKDVVFNDCMG